MAAFARDLGVGWASIMRAVRDHGNPLVDDPARLQGMPRSAGRAEPSHRDPADVHAVGDRLGGLGARSAA